MGKREGMEERGSYRVCEHVLVTYRVLVLLIADTYSYGI